MICLDIRPTIGLNLNVFNVESRKKEKILTHPIVIAYIMLQYSSLYIIFLFTLIVKLFFATLLSCLPLMLNAKSNSTNTDDKDRIRDDYLFWTVYALTTGTTYF